MGASVEGMLELWDVAKGYGPAFRVDSRAPFTARKTGWEGRKRPRLAN